MTSPNPFRGIVRVLHFLILTTGLIASVSPLTTCRLDAAGPRVLPEGKLPEDRRLLPLKDLDGYFPFTPPKSVDEWQVRAERVKRQILVSQGLWPMPEKTPLNPVVHGKVERDGFTVERVYFESFPGFFVTGSLYRPEKKADKMPGVLCPHGHWANGRFYDNGRDNVRKEIVNGAERFEEGGRSPLQSRCMQLARMGCVVFHYDMIGYADCTQLSFDLAHRFAKQRPEMNTAENWGLFSPQAEANLQSIMGLQTWNSVRALDFITSLSDVDPARIAVTGASGGGTQTMLLGAVDPRCTVIWPAVMVSTSMQGGCTCENASCLRVDTGNIEFASLFAPKPQGMSAANDWTKEMATKGFPEIKQLYGLFNAADNVTLKATIHFDHNYNYPNRAAMYSWFNKHLKLNFPEPVVEEDFKRLSTEEMTVWDAQHPRPEGGPDYERKLVRQWTEDARRQLAAATPTDAKSLEKFRSTVGGGIDAILGQGLPAASDLEYEQINEADRADYLLMSGVLHGKSRGQALPMAFLHPKQWNGQVVIWLHPAGKAGLFTNGDQPTDELRQLLKAGTSIVGVDLLYQGEFLSKGQPLEQTGKVKNPREFAGYTFGFNHTVLASRVHDILSVVSFVRSHEMKPKQVDLVGLEGNTGLLAAVARAQARGAVDRAAVNVNDFRFAKLLDYHHPDFLVGGAKYGDVPGFLAVAAPGRTWLATTGDEAPALVAAAYKAAGASDAVTHVKASAKADGAVVNWLLKK